jgi:hypothetical protein
LLHQFRRHLFWSIGRTDGCANPRRVLAFRENLRVDPEFFSSIRACTPTEKLQSPPSSAETRALPAGKDALPDDRSDLSSRLTPSSVRRA